MVLAHVIIIVLRLYESYYNPLKVSLASVIANNAHQMETGYSSG